MRNFKGLTVGMIAVMGTASTANAAFEISTVKLGDAATAKFNALFQAWSLGNENATPRDQSFRFRRMELKLSGTFAKDGKYFFMADPARLIPPHGGKPVPTEQMIQDFGTGYRLIDGLELTVGQFKIPTTAEGLDSSGDLPLPERSLVGRNFGDRRELGVKLGYKQQLWNVAAMLTTGQPVTSDGHRGLNDLSARAELTPDRNLAFGTYATFGDMEYNKRGRWGVNSRYKIKKADLRAEYGIGRDSAVHSQGITTEAGYWISENLEPVLRYETFSPNQTFGNAAKAETVGVNYFMRDYNAKLQLAGSAMQNMSAPLGTMNPTKGSNNKLITLVVQASI